MRDEAFGVHYFTQALKWAWLSVAQFSSPASGGSVKSKGSVAPVPARSQSSDRLFDGRRQLDGLTWKDVEERNTPDCCWIVIRGKVYDVTEFGNVHPGGKVIFTQGGRDATEAFTGFHSKATWAMLKGLYVGDLVEAQETKSSAILKDFRELRNEFVKRGLFKASKAFYAYKLLSNLVLLAFAMGALYASQTGYLGMLFSAFLLGLFFQQCGWLAHDFLHHQVFTNRWVNNAFGYLVGNLFQGFSVDWWKSKHNTHHAVPNELDAGMGAMDPDIDTLPLLAWSTDMLDTVSDAAHRAIIRVQHYLFFPVLTFARLTWAQQSLFHTFWMTDKKPVKGWTELGLILLHYCWFIGLPVMVLTPLKAVLYVILTQCLCGFMLGIAFVQSHNGMEVYSDTKDFVTAQIVSTRDITYNIWVDWFMGGLNYQIEHHLFPTMPRHNLGKIQPFIRDLCKKHDLPYEECDMVTGTRRVLQRLFEVAKEA